MSFLKDGKESLSQPGETLVVVTHLVIKPHPSCMVQLERRCWLVCCVSGGLTASRSIAQRWMMLLQLEVKRSCIFCRGALLLCSSQGSTGSSWMLILPVQTRSRPRVTSRAERKHWKISVPKKTQWWKSKKVKKYDYSIINKVSPDSNVLTSIWNQKTQDTWITILIV